MNFLGNFGEIRYIRAVRPQKWLNEKTKYVVITYKSTTTRVFSCSQAESTPARLVVELVD